jgi:hypothetical protein
MSLRKIIAIIILLLIIALCLIFFDLLQNKNNIVGYNIEGFNTDSFTKAKKLLETSTQNGKYYSDTTKLSDLSKMGDQTIQSMITNNSELSDSGKCSFIHTQVLEALDQNSSTGKK